jgi:hypothetical protein
MIETKTSRAEIRMHTFVLNARAYYVYTGMYVSIVLVLDSDIFQKKSLAQVAFVIVSWYRFAENSKKSHQNAAYLRPVVSKIWLRNFETLMLLSYQILDFFEGCVARVRWSWLVHLLVNKNLTNLQQLARIYPAAASTQS